MLFAHIYIYISSCNSKKYNNNNYRWLQVFSILFQVVFFIQFFSFVCEFNSRKVLIKKWMVFWLVERLIFLRHRKRERVWLEDKKLWNTAADEMNDLELCVLRTLSQQWVGVRFSSTTTMKSELAQTALIMDCVCLREWFAKADLDGCYITLAVFFRRFYCVEMNENYSTLYIGIFILLYYYTILLYIGIYYPIILLHYIILYYYIIILLYSIFLRDLRDSLAIHVKIIF